MLENSNFNKISVIIPVFNEKNTISKIVEKVDNTDINGLTKEIIIVDDGSTDGTREILPSFENDHIKTFYHQKNQGKGAALHTAFKQITGDLIVIQDADLEYDPAEYKELTRPILDGRADIVYGSRFIGHKPHRVLYFWHSIGNKFITLFCNIFSNLNLTDIETCYKTFTKEVIQQIKLKEKRFGFEPEFTIKAAKQKFRFYEIGISYTGRTYQEGKKINAKDGFQALWCIVRYGIFG